MKKVLSEADGCNTNMDIEYQNDIKKGLKSGKTEGQVILDWLKKNEQGTKKELARLAKQREDLFKKIGKPT